MDIGKSNDKFKDSKLKCFNCNSIAIWPRNVGTKKKRNKPKSVSSVTKKDILQKTIKESSQ